MSASGEHDDAIGANPVELIARFARRAHTDAPRGTVQLEGHEPVSFAGWMELMAIVEEFLEAAGIPEP